MHEGLPYAIVQIKADRRLPTQLWSFEELLQLPKGCRLFRSVDKGQRCVVVYFLMFAANSRKLAANAP